MKYIKKYNESINNKLIKDIIDDIDDTLIELVDRSIIMPQHKGIETLTNKIRLKYHCT